MKIFWCFLMLFQGMMFAETSQPVLRVLVLADTRIESHISNGVEKDIEHMTKTVQTIAKKIKYSLDFTVLKDSVFTTQSIKNWLQALPQSSSDITIFYYSGHGCSNPQHGPWPALGLSDAVIGGSAIVQYMKEHRHRLDIILFDACNSQCDIEIWQQFKSDTFALSYEKHQPGLKKLFRETRGFIVAAASKPGEFAGVTNYGVSRGSFFTNAFLVALKKYSTKKSTSWRKVFRTTGKVVEQFSHNRQHIVYEIE